MPEISRFFGMRINMYWDDHSPPHFHVEYGEYEALFAIETGQKLKGRFPKTGEKIIGDWAKQKKGELLANWQLARKGEPLNKIRGPE